MHNPRTGETVAYVGDKTIDGERVVAMRSPTNRRHLRFRYFEHRVFPDEGEGGREPKENAKNDAKNHKRAAQQEERKDESDAESDAEEEGRR